MSPRKADPAVRSVLIATAARLLAQDGSNALTLRRVTSDAGTSTMAVYTHFGGMDELKREVRRTGYAALAEALTAAGTEIEPLCRAYAAFAREQPDLYRVMFMEAPLDEQDAAECAGTFAMLAEGAQRHLGPEGDGEALAMELWAAGHGVVTLELSALLTPEQAESLAASLRAKLL
ncbi:WHG domain-containing protein [Solirubrobacter sp. CPCC 204708]|uniref:WHG domain-containing protein n=1 Tax=Solirubrobacter deserti TaxID=2282478 RepID=A0ABT4REY3_9ACTN|nr:WHG domain-containing protein [Solirubrobacter deserti]MBE2318632.1 WHG domain-containing protein [Solirubrobacter deserti]MDA0137090.1 WHG domain-containing protein [Solirubrobacter deserti]